MYRMLGKIVSLVSILLLVLGGFSSRASAQNELMFGQTHFYTVVFRGNGEAITYAKLAITNSDDAPMTDFSFDIPNVSPTEMTIYQMTLPQECTAPNYKDEARPCSAYRDPDYTKRYYPNRYDTGEAEYRKIDFTKSGSRYTLTLPTPVQPYKSTAIIVAYAAQGYTSENLGLYTFNFETIKVASRIQNVTVAVDVDSDLFLKGKKSSVNYGLSTARVSDMGMSQSVSSPTLDNVVNQIGSYAAIIKEAKNLSSNESFTVKGEYAKSWLRLYITSIILSIVVVCAVLYGIYFVTKLLKRRNEGKEQIIAVADVVASPSAQTQVNAFSFTHALAGLVSSSLIVGITAIGTVFDPISILMYAVGREPIAQIVVVIMILLLYVLSIFGPAIFVAIKHGWKSFLSVLVAELAWFIIFIIVYLVLFQTGLSSAFYGSQIMM